MNRYNYDQAIYHPVPLTTDDINLIRGLLAAVQKEFLSWDASNATEKEKMAWFNHLKQVVDLHQRLLQAVPS